jgi:hypothetical protein
MKTFEARMKTLIKVIVDDDNDDDNRMNIYGSYLAAIPLAYAHSRRFRAILERPISLAVHCDSKYYAK